MILKKWTSIQLIKKIRFSQKRALWGLVGITVVVLIYFLGVLPLVEAAKKAEGEILLKRKVILKYDDYLQNRKVVEENLNRAIKQYEAIQQRLLPGDTPQLGAATLQEVVKLLSEKNRIVVRSFKILEPKEIFPYRKVSMQIDFNPMNSMLGLGQFIHDVEHHEKELMISEMDFLVFNIRMPVNIQGSMVISGLMKGAKSKEKGKER